jgi:hypothetical protein
MLTHKKTANIPSHHVILDAEKPTPRINAGHWPDSAQGIKWEAVKKQALTDPFSRQKV